MAAWVHGSKMDAASFARHFFGRAADDPVVGSLRAAVSEAVEATTRPQLAAASGDLAKAITAVGLDGWPRFVADAQARAHEKATLAAIQKSLQPPDVRKDAIKPVYPVETALVAGAAAVTGGVSGLVGAAARAIGGMVVNKILPDTAAPSDEAPERPATSANETPPKPSAAPSGGPPSPAGTAGSMKLGYTTAYRAVSQTEYDNALSTGKFSQGPNSLEGKWFADTYANALLHGDALDGFGNFRILEADLPDDAPSLFKVQNLDGRGPATYIHLDDLRGVTPRPYSGAK
jgi:hypothetical protein